VAGRSGVRGAFAGVEDAEISLNQPSSDRGRDEADDVGEPVTGRHSGAELTEFETGFAQKGLECPQLRLAAEDCLGVAGGLEQRLMRFGQNEDENGVLVAGAVARMLEREVLGQKAREVRIELGDCDGRSP
jgi:hypothetical protein